MNMSTKWEHSEKALDDYRKFLRREAPEVLNFDALEVCRLRKAHLVRFEVPPPQLWSNMIAPLVCAQRFRDILQNYLICGNGYRPRWYNTAVGGSRRSTHIKNMAIDLDLPSDQRNFDSEKRFYEMAVSYHMSEEARKAKMGLGLYEDEAGSRIHIDFGYRYRFWGGFRGSYYKRIRKRIR